MVKTDISMVKVTPLQGYGSLIAMASLNFRGVVLRGLKLLEKENKKWIGMPARKKGNKWEDVYFIMDGRDRESIFHAVLEEYIKEIKNE